MKVYLINLDRHTDRLAHMREQLAGIAFERIVAVDGSQAPETKPGLTRSELACLVSHRSAWRRFLATVDSHACFLEDDLHLQNGFAAVARDGGWIPADAHSVKLDTYLQRVRLGERRSAPDGRQLAALYTRHESSAAYALSRAGAERYLELTTVPSLPTDYALFPKKPRRVGLRVYQLTPAVAIQDHLRAPEEGGLVFPTAMADREGRARRPLLARVRREGRRLFTQTADLAEATYARLVLKAETTTVGFG